MADHHDDGRHDDERDESRSADPGRERGLPRRQFIQAGAAGAAIAAAGLGGMTGAVDAVTGQGDRHGGNPFGRPNFLFICVDEQRFPVVYESPQLRAWRQQFLRAQNALARNGVSLLKHSIASCACVPSRTSLFTGQYPSLHGCTATDGGGKSAIEEDMFWLQPNTLPTMGNYFRAAGYRTVYKGKWHVSEASLFAPGNHSGPVETFDANGFPDPMTTDIYLKANVLGQYGFDGWVGPEPHPTSAANVGRMSASSAQIGLSGRDIVYGDQVVEQIQAFDRNRSDHRPWLLVASFVDPHDIALFGVQAWLATWLADQGLGEACGPISPLAFDNPATTPQATQLFDNAKFLQTLNDNLNTKPSCQKSNEETYRQYIQGIVDIPRYLRYYYTLQQRADDQMFKVLEALKRSRFYDNTIVVFTSDHGDYLSSHGNQHQKWYSAYEEIVHVPCVISNPRMFPRPKTVDAATNHIDLIPTMLGLAGIDPEPIRRQLALSFTEARRLVGRNLAGLVTGRVPSSAVKEPVYFMTDDDMSRGSNQFNWIGYPYNSVVQPNHIETVLVWFEGAYWKYSRYFDSPQFWSAAGDVGCGKDSVVGGVTANKPAGSYTVSVGQTVKTTPIPAQFEMYNVTADPMELNNLAGNPAYRRQQAELAAMLEAESCAKRLQPSYAPPPGAQRCA
jgi:choline-sulfatase